VVTAPKTAAPLVIRPLGEPGDVGWVVMAHGEVYAAELGWDTSFEAVVARIVADYAADHDPAREAAWIAELGPPAHTRRLRAPPPEVDRCTRSPRPRDPHRKRDSGVAR
jgi:hypothetical protein